MTKVLEKLNGNVEFYEKISSLLDEMKKKDFYPIESFKHTIDTGISEWYSIMIKGKKGFPVGENNLVIIDINESYMNVSGNYFSDGEFDLKEGDFVELFFKNFLEYEKMLNEIKEPLLEQYDEVVEEVRKVIGSDYIIVQFRDTLVFKIMHRETQSNVFRFELNPNGVDWEVNEFPSFIKKFNDCFVDFDIRGEDEFESLKERVGNVFNEKE